MRIEGNLIIFPLAYRLPGDAVLLPQRQAFNQAKAILEEATGAKVEAVSASERHESFAASDGEPDLILQCERYLFIVEAKRSSSASLVFMAAKRLRRFLSETRKRTPRSTIIVPLLVVPYMGEVGQRICEEEEISWLDLSGNSGIKAPRLRVLISGRENRFARRGRKATPFAPKASRLARQFLLEPERRYAQSELVESTGLDQGFVSRTLQTLERENLIRRKGRLFEVVNASLLLDSWQEVYDFTKHRILKGHIPTRSSEDLTFSLSRAVQSKGVYCAATGLAGAWLLTRFVSFRLVTLYLKEEPTPEVLAELGFREQEKGANVWLVVPNDDGVFFGGQTLDEVYCVHPVQVYLDLKFHPERSAEAAEHLREKCLVPKNA